MYRKNISHILSYIVAVVGLFILYHVWMKPSYFPPTPPPPVTTVPAEEETQPTAEQKHEEELYTRESKRPRVIDPSRVPESPYVAKLDGIRDELEKGNAAEAESRLSDLPSPLLAEPPVRRFVAVLWNNLGILQEQSGGTAVSVKTFKQAVSLDSTNPIAHLNLAHAYWELRDPGLTEEFLQHVIQLAPTEAFPHLAMADLLQEQDRLAEAAQHLDRAADRARQDPDLRSYLQAVSAKVRRTEQAEQQLTSRGSAHFTVKFDGGEDQATWTGVLDILEEAYRDIGQKFGHFPGKPIIVVLHTRDHFQSATGSPIWADGLFDPVLGRIQVPTQGALTDQTWLTRVLRHEYVHALLHDQLGVGAGSVPTWLNEGLAMQLAGDSWADLDQPMHGDIALVPLAVLEGGWGTLSSGAATVAYLEANSATHYLIDRFGMHRVKELLNLLKSRHTMPAAMQDTLSLTYEQFERRWVDDLNARLKSGKRASPKRAIPDQFTAG